MKVAFAMFGLFTALVLYVSAQEVGSDELLNKFKNLRHLIISTGQVKESQNKLLSWKDRTTCLPDDLSLLPQRLLDWFHVLKSRSQKESVDDGSQTTANIGCSSPALTWFFKEFDSNKDMMLDASELETVQSIPYEHCLKQFFQQCDLDKDRKLTLDETCRCFAVEPPCAQALKDYKHLIGEYRPQCDEDGFYKPRQCHEGYCWCVDRFNEVIEGTRTDKLVECPDNTDPNEALFTGDEDEEEQRTY